MNLIMRSPLRLKPVDEITPFQTAIFHSFTVLTPVRFFPLLFVPLTILIVTLFVITLFFILSSSPEVPESEACLFIRLIMPKSWNPPPGESPQFGYFFTSHAPFLHHIQQGEDNSIVKKRP